MQYTEILTNRRAINFFDPEKDVDTATLNTILEMAGKAPSSFNLQPWKVVVVRSAEEKAKLRPLAFDQPKVTEAPITLIILADRGGWKEGNQTLETVFTKGMQPEQRDWFIKATSELYGANDNTQQAFANKNAGLFAMSLMYAASELGLHTHPMDGFNHDEVRKAFGIPEQYWIPMLIAIGHKKADVEIHPKGWRQTTEELILKTI